MFRPRRNDIRHMSQIMYGYKQPVCLAINKAVLLTGQTDSGCVYNGHHLLQVIAQHTVEQLLVALLENLKKPMCKDLYYYYGLSNVPRSSEWVCTSLTLVCTSLWVCTCTSLTSMPFSMVIPGLWLLNTNCPPSHMIFALPFQVTPS